MKYIELSLKNHLILHGFDKDGKEILEEVKAENYSKKMVAVHRILSLSQKYILISYAFDRIVYWEYEESYEQVKALLEQS